MKQTEAVRLLQEALLRFFEDLEAKGIPWPATIGDAAAAAAIKKQAECHNKESTS